MYYMKKLFLVILIMWTSVAFAEDALDPYDSVNHAFTMIGDSRTQWIIWAGPAAGLSSRWDAPEFLGKYHNSAISKAKIQNIGWSGSTASQWERHCYYDAPPCKSSEMAKRIVIMIGGNDVINRSGEWVNLPWTTREIVKNQILDSIHGDVKNIVKYLVARQKEVIIQGHYKVNPDKVGGSYLDKYRAWNEGLMGLRQRLEIDFIPHWYVVSPGKFYIKGWRSICGWLGWCPFCFFGCIPIPIVVWQAPVLEIRGGYPNTSYAFLPTDFPAAFFWDDKHPNSSGIIYQSEFLKNELRNRGWW
jgi:lysophospholipase L1-like esterase